MKNIWPMMLATLAACTTLETRPVKVTEVYPSGSIKANASPANGGRAAADTVAPPPLQTAQQWTYRRVDLWRNQEIERFRQELVFEDGGRWMVRWTILNSDDAQRRGSITGELFNPSSHGFADSRISGDHAPLRFPLASGKSWSFEYVVRSKGKEVKVRQTAIARGWEEVRVPAGSFRAIRVEHDGRYQASEGEYSWSGKIREIYWYAPAAGRVVMREYRDTKGDGGPWDQWRDELVTLKL